MPKPLNQTYHYIITGQITNLMPTSIWIPPESNFKLQTADGEWWCEGWNSWYSGDI